jgi:hypothetical protein
MRRRIIGYLQISFLYKNTLKEYPSFEETRILKFFEFCLIFISICVLCRQSKKDKLWKEGKQSRALANLPQQA